MNNHWHIQGLKTRIFSRNRYKKHMSINPRLVNLFRYKNRTMGSSLHGLLPSNGILHFRSGILCEKIFHMYQNPSLFISSACVPYIYVPVGIISALQNSFGATLLSNLLLRYNWKPCSIYAYILCASSLSILIKKVWGEVLLQNQYLLGLLFGLSGENMV